LSHFLHLFLIFFCFKIKGIDKKCVENQHLLLKINTFGINLLIYMTKKRYCDF